MGVQQGRVLCNSSQGGVTNSSDDHICVRHQMNVKFNGACMSGGGLNFNGCDELCVNVNDQNDHQDAAYGSGMKAAHMPRDEVKNFVAYGNVNLLSGDPLP